MRSGDNSDTGDDDDDDEEEEDHYDNKWDYDTNDYNESIDRSVAV